MHVKLGCVVGPRVQQTQRHWQDVWECHECMSMVLSCHKPTCPPYRHPPCTALRCVMLYCRCIQYLQWYTSDSRSLRAGASPTSTSSKTGVTVPENSDWHLASLRGTFGNGERQQQAMQCITFNAACFIHGSGNSWACHVHCSRVCNPVYPVYTKKQH
jgi:hypothetical protein